MSATWRQNLLISHLRIQESRQSQQGGRLFLSRIGRCQFGLEDGLSHLRGCLDHLRPQRAALLGQLLFAQDGTKLIARLHTHHHQGLQTSMDRFGIRLRRPVEETTLRHVFHSLFIHLLKKLFQQGCQIVPLLFQIGQVAMIVIPVAMH